MSKVQQIAQIVKAAKGAAVSYKEIAEQMQVSLQSVTGSVAALKKDPSFAFEQGAVRVVDLPILLNLNKISSYVKLQRIFLSWISLISTPIGVTMNPDFFERCLSLHLCPCQDTHLHQSAQPVYSDSCLGTALRCSNSS